MFKFRIVVSCDFFVAGVSIDRKAFAIVMNRNYANCKRVVTKQNHQKLTQRDSLFVMNSENIMLTIFGYLWKMKVPLDINTYKESKKQKKQKTKKSKNLNKQKKSKNQKNLKTKTKTKKISKPKKSKNQKNIPKT